MKQCIFMQLCVLNWCPPKSTTKIYWSNSLLTTPSTSLCSSMWGSLLQDTFVGKVQRSVAKTNKLTRKKRRAWHTEESMMKKLDWSKPL